MYVSDECLQSGSVTYPPHDAGLTQILALVVEEVRDSISRDINGADLLFSLLNAPWLQSLLKVSLFTVLVLSRNTKEPLRTFDPRLSLVVKIIWLQL